MKASTQYDDFKGTVSADISDLLGSRTSDDFKGIAEYFKLDQERFKIVGLSIYGTSNFSVSLICVDKKESTSENEKIVKMLYDKEKETDILDILFKRLNIVLHNKYEKVYDSMDSDLEVRYTDFH